MCDYSLANAKTRPAVENEKLTTNNFGSGTTGFRSAGDKALGPSATAVCVLPGTEIAFARSVEVTSMLERQANVNGEMIMIGGAPATDVRTATFIQVDKGQPYRHHDALQFSDGKIVPLTYLVPGQEATVLTLPAAPRTAKEREAQTRVTEYA